MRKSLPKILIIVLMLLMVCTLFACNEKFEPLVEAKGGKIEDKDSQSLTYAKNAKYIGFKYTTEPTSILHHIYVDEFNLSQIKFFVIYEYEDGSQVLGSDKDLTLEMVDKSSRPLLKQAGHHQIFCSYKYLNKTLHGSFSLHLKDRDQNDFVDLAFNPNGGHAQFGTPDGNIVKAKIYENTTLSWSEFISNFKVARQHFSLVEWKYDGKVFNSNSEPITISNPMLFEAVWSENSINVKFDLNKPEGAIENDPAPIQPDAIEIYAYEGMIPRPDMTKINRLHGYSFLGWYDKADQTGKVWNFNSKVGNSDITLYAHWALKTYSLTYFLLGGEFLNDLDDATSKTNVLNFIDYNKSDKTPYKLRFEGLRYDQKYSDYTSTVLKTMDGDELKLNISDVQNVLSKGDGYYDVENWYSKQSYDEDSVYDMNADAKVENNLTLYAKWKLSDSVTDLDDYYLNFLFKNEITVKANGTLRIDKLVDTSVNEIIIPEFINIPVLDENGNKQFDEQNNIITEKRYITEIGKIAFQNAQALLKVDMSAASALKKINSGAFEHCVDLKSVIFPENNNIEYIGENAFVNTKWQDTYKEKTGEDFIIVNNILCKYVGDTSVTEITIPENIVTIASGCFLNNKNLEKINLNNQTRRIEDLAFSKATALKEISIDEENTLLNYIGANAFDGTNYIKGVENANKQNNAIVIGNIYYRYVGFSTDTSATIPDSVKIIAPLAFVGYSKIDNIVFENDCHKHFKKIGKDAFTDTKWVTQEHYIDAKTFVDNKGFVIINGILTNYVGSDTIVVIPNAAKIIVENAFGGYARNVKNILIPENLEKIESRAFAGATSLNGISFRNKSTDALIDIAEDSFSDESGVLMDIEIYLHGGNDSPYELLSTDGNIHFDTWKVLYKANPNNFVNYKTTKMEINYDVMPQKYLNKTNEDFEFKNYWASIGLLDSSEKFLIDAVFVTYSDGITYKENLLFNNCKQLNKKIGYHSESILKATYNYTIYSNIKDATPFDKANPETTTIHGDDENSAIKIEGLEEHYYTSIEYPDLSKAVLKFEKLDGTEAEIPITSSILKNYSNQQNTKGRYMKIKFNYEGFDDYVIDWRYTVSIPKDKEIEQIEGIVFPLNADVREYLETKKIKITKEDGESRNVFLLSSDIKVVEVNGQEADKFDTTVLGFNFARIQYQNQGDNHKIYANLTYSVVLEATPSLFTYETIRDGNSRTAKITGFDRTRSSSTLVLPSKIKVSENVDNEGKELETPVLKDYTVVEIDDRAFVNLNADKIEDNPLIEYIYIPNTIKSIGNEAFKNCINLKGVYSFVSVDYAVPVVKNTPFAVLEEEIFKQGNVNAISISEIAMAKDSVVVPNTFEIIKEEQNENNGIEYSTTYTYTCSLILSETMFDNYLGTIYMYDNTVNHTYADAHLTNNNVVFFTEGHEFDKNDFEYSNYNTPIFPEENITTINQKVTILKASDLVPVNKNLIIPSYIEGKISESKVKINRTIIGYEAGAFDNLTNVDMVFLPNSITRVGETLSGKTFTTVIYQTGKQTLIAPSHQFSDNIETIGKSAFQNCTSLEYVDFSHSEALTEIGMFAFANSGIKTMDLSHTSLTEIMDSCFDNCKHLTSVTLPETVVRISIGAFYECSNLVSVVPTGQLEEVLSKAFYNCINFVPFDVTGIDVVDPTAFDGCKIA